MDVFLEHHICKKDEATHVDLETNQYFCLKTKNDINDFFDLYCRSASENNALYIQELVNEKDLTTCIFECQLTFSKKLDKIPTRDLVSLKFMQNYISICQDVIEKHIDDCRSICFVLESDWYSDDNRIISITVVFPFVHINLMMKKYLLHYVIEELYNIHYMKFFTVYPLAKSIDDSLIVNFQSFPLFGSYMSNTRKTYKAKLFNICGKKLFELTFTEVFDEEKTDLKMPFYLSSSYHPPELKKKIYEDVEPLQVLIDERLTTTYKDKQNIFLSVGVLKEIIYDWTYAHSPNFGKDEKYLDIIKSIETKYKELVNLLKQKLGENSYVRSHREFRFHGITYKNLEDVNMDKTYKLPKSFFIFRKRYDE